MAARFEGTIPCDCGPLRAPSAFTLRATGASGTTYTTFQPRSNCGLVIPDEVPNLWLFPAAYQGPPVEGNVCWQIPAADAGSVVLSYQPLQLAEMPLPRPAFDTHPPGALAAARLQR